MISLERFRELPYDVHEKIRAVLRRVVSPSELVQRFYEFLDYLLIVFVCVELHHEIEYLDAQYAHDLAV